jgi:CMP-N-acetylneuraminic acid synthetase
MHAIAGRLGVASPTLRPSHLATDAATTADVVAHVIAECGIDRGYLLLLQATAPLRTLADLDGLCTAFESAEADAAVSVTPQDEPRPEKLRRIVDGYAVPYLEAGYEGPRQGLPMPYALNGAFYLIGRDTFLRERKFLPPRTLAYVMPPERSHNLDTLQDWHILEAMIAAGHWQAEAYD